MISLDQAGLGLGCAEITAPPAALGPWVEYLWVQRYPRHLSRGDWLVVPDASAHLLVHCGWNGTSVRLVGARSRAIRFPVRDRQWTVGVRFRPGSLAALVGGAAQELTDQAVPFVDVASHGALDRLRIREWRTPNGARTEVERVLSRLLIGRAVPDWRVRGLVDRSRTGRGEGGVATSARSMGVGMRGLREVVRGAVGFSPKMLQRVLRIQRAAAGVLDTPGEPLGRIAARLGFSDQPHLSREFRSLMGESPTTYRRRLDADSFTSP